MEQNMPQEDENSRSEMLGAEGWSRSSSWFGNFTLGSISASSSFVRALDQIELHEVNLHEVSTTTSTRVADLKEHKQLASTSLPSMQCAQLSSSDPPGYSGSKKHIEIKDEKSKPMSWQEKYFALAIGCLEAGIVNGKICPEEFTRFKIYLGPPTYKVQFKQNEAQVMQALKSRDVASDYSLVESVDDYIKSLSLEDVQRLSEEPHNNTFRNQMKIIQKKWLEKRLQDFNLKVLSPTRDLLQKAGHTEEHVSSYLRESMQQQCEAQLQKKYQNFFESVIEPFFENKNMGVMKEKISVKLQELYPHVTGEFVRQKQMQEASKSQEKSEKDKFYEYFENVIFEDIKALCKHNRVNYIGYYYSHQITLQPGEALLLRKWPWLLFPAEREQMPAIHTRLRVVAKNIVSDLRACCEASHLLQYQIVDAEGHSLLHHALARLKKCKTHEQRQFIMSFITELYAHGAMPFEGAHSERSVVERSDILKQPYLDTHKLECWQLLLLRLEYTSCFSEAESRAKEALWVYGSKMPELLSANRIYQLYKDWHGLKRGSRFADMYALVRALIESGESLNDDHLTDQIQISRSREGARADSSDLFRSVNNVKAGIENGSVIFAKHSARESKQGVGSQRALDPLTESRQMYEEQCKINAALRSYLKLVVRSSSMRVYVRPGPSLLPDEKSASSFAAPVTRVQAAGGRSTTDISSLLQFSLLSQAGQDQSQVTVGNVSVSQQTFSAVEQPGAPNAEAQTSTTTGEIASSNSMES